MRKFVLKGLLLSVTGVILVWVANSLISDLFTRRYVYFQICVLLVVLGVLWWKKGWHTHTNTAASVLTIVGVLGTFIGIFVGLQEFTISNDSDEMQESISKLLEGLKFAFGTSIVGIGSALFLKGLISPFVKIFIKPPGIDKEVLDKLADGLKTALEPLMTFDGLITALKEDNRTTRNVLRGMRTDLTEGQNKALTQLETLTTTVSEKHNALLNGVKDALTPIQTSLMDEQTGILTKLEELTTTVSEKHDALLNGTMPALTAIQDSLTDSETGVLTKLETLTTTVSAEHNQLRKEFETFSNNVAESITKLATNELIAALSKVIEEFNAKISEQFGDNFKQLNEAVGKTVEWQKEHRQNMDKLADEFMVAAESIEQSRVSLENIAESSSAIVERSDRIVSCAEKLEPILHTMNDQLEAFSTLRQNANDAFPLIEERLNELTNGFSSTVQEAITNSQTSIEAQREAFNEQSEQLQSVMNGLDDFTEKIEGVTQNVSSTVENLTTSLGTSEEFKRNLVSMQNDLKEQLAKSMETLGKDLAALSEKFVKDYTPLTEALRQVLTIAEGVLPRNPRN